MLTETISLTKLIVALGKTWFSMEAKGFMFVKK